MQAFRSVFEQVWDVVVLGAGYAGFAAAQQLHAVGKRVLLVGRDAAILWESGWAFSTAVGTSTTPQWRQLIGAMPANAVSGGLIDGAIAEVRASSLIQQSGLPVLYYAAPVAAWREASGRVGALAMATKSGVKVLIARAWIDATDAGELCSLLDRDWRPATPQRQEINLYLRNVEYAQTPALELPCTEIQGATLSWRPGQWPNERILTVSLPGDSRWHRDAWLPALRALRDKCSDAAGAVLTHGSTLPMGIYGASDSAHLSLPDNVETAVPGVMGAARSLAERFELGLVASQQLSDAKAARGAVPPLEFADSIKPARHLEASVVVAGVGTGGAFAAIAAGREGADVLAFDPLPFAGGIGTGGGIHVYYFGVRGGLQEEADQRTREIMPLFGETRQIVGFHPDAKKIVLEQMMREAGVRLQYESATWAAGRDGRRITHADLATPTGPARVSAKVWIDCTGDADLAAAAGAQFSLGRQGDGQLHAYSQSSGRAGCQDFPGAAEGTHVRMARLHGVNYDAGFVDPTDSEDLTRGRLVGIGHYEQEQFTETERPTYIAPAIGLRQARQIETDYAVTLADLLERRRFPDAVGMTGAHYDNHAVDYEFETDEAMFWVWCCRQWRAGRTACELPYRMMLPKGLDNVMLACRAAGVSEEAHHSLRMQRDFQRLGEAAGYAAAMITQDVPADTRSVSYPALRAKLEKTGSLHAAERGDGFGVASETLYPAGNLDDGQQLRAWVDEVRSSFSPAMYHIMNREAQTRESISPMLQSADPMQSWRAATIIAMWRDAAAEARLLQAIEGREYGFDNAPQEFRPETNNRLAPHWVVAVALLRRCGTAACLPALCALAGDSALLHNARTALALTLSSLAHRLQLDDQQRRAVADGLKALLTTDAPNAVGNPQRKVVNTATPGEPAPTQRRPVIEDFTWQLHLAVAQAERAAKLPVHEQAWAFLGDPRATVRRAFNRVLQPF